MKLLNYPRTSTEDERGGGCECTIKEKIKLKKNKQIRIEI